MRKFNIGKVFIFLVVFIFTFILRAHNYDRVPTPAHLDEMLYAWSGLYLIETGTPVSWSTLDYPKRAEVFKGKIDYKGGQPEASVTLYKPWLDQPPLFSTLVGFFAHLYGASKEEFIPVSFIRLPIIFISTTVSVLVFLIARKLSGYWIGILSMIVYGTTPIFVFASRTALPESLIAFTFTLMVYLLIKFMENQRFIYIAFIPLLVGFSGLSKTTGFFLAPLAIFLVFYAFGKRKLKLGLRYSMYIAIATLPFIIGFFLYGKYFDWEIFKTITTIQASRPIGFSSLAWFLITPSFDTSILKDSWYVFCVISAIFFVFQPKESLKKIISLAFIYWVIVVMLTGGESDLLAWYRFPSFPMLAILGTWGLLYLIKNANIFTTFLGAGLLLGNRLLLSNAFRSNISPQNYRLVLATLFVPSILSFIDNRKPFQKIMKFVMILTVSIGIYFNIVYIYNAFEITCESKTCPLVPSTFVSRLHFPIIWRIFVLGKPDIYWCGDRICRD